MACCILAAFILAQIMAMVRRWGIFWGVVKPVEGEDADNVYQRIKAWFALPKVRAAVFAIAAIEFAAFGSWVYLEHGEHLYRLGDQAAARMRGDRVVYAGVCAPDGKDRMIRVVLDGSSRRTTWSVVS